MRRSGLVGDVLIMPIVSLELELRSSPVLGSNFQAPSRFSVLEAVGQGAYGVVCSARDDANDDTVAIKKIEPPTRRHRDVFWRYIIHINCIR